MLIDSAEGLASFVERASSADALAVDAEFLRERTYYPRLCLLQLATDEEAVAVDPLSGLDLAPLGSLMRDRGITKVFHAGGQDIEILCRVFGAPPAPVFDTQIAATLAGHAAQTSYQDLVGAVLGVSLEKSQRYTDWSARPLSKEQVEYALDDVRYLLPLYRTIRGLLESSGRLAWLADEFERMADPATYAVVPEQQYLRVKRASSLRGRSLAVLRELAAWREREAQQRDIPRRWLVPDETLIEIARRAPEREADLAGIRGLSDQVARRYGRAIVEAVQRGRAVPRDQWPSLPHKHARRAVPSEVVDLMAALVRARAREHGVAPTLIASRSDLEAFAEGEPDSPLASGWRHAMVGAELEGLLRGEIELAVSGNGIVVRPIEPPLASENGGES
ncbi:MAG: ribonuclease D [Coriobacteriia bacterium]|nr:ribonuclease D [Coriobacteriia bacterium]